MEGLNAFMAQMDPGTLHMFQTCALLLQQEQQAAKQQLEEELRIVDGVRKVVDRCGDFDGWNVSSFLTKYMIAMEEFQVPEEEMIRCFEILTEDYVRPEVVEVKKACGNTWDTYQRGLCQQFANRDVKGWMDDDILSSEVIGEDLGSAVGSGLGCSGIEEDTACDESREVCDEKVVTTEEFEANEVQSFRGEDLGDSEQVLDDVGVPISQLGVEELQGSQLLLHTVDSKEEHGKTGLEVQRDVKVEAGEVTEDFKLAPKNFKLLKCLREHTMIQGCWFGLKGMFAWVGFLFGVSLDFSSVKKVRRKATVGLREGCSWHGLGSRKIKDLVLGRSTPFGLFYCTLKLQ
ncbi:hypothetical protein R1sor_012503 [Riccia sorocarpa]|uniref:Uncharacterized protein n=1 Tax=Riccia sorocarpa TaxID=122646 RepID=A0ABD3I7Z6_9MARC